MKKLLSLILVITSFHIQALSQALWNAEMRQSQIENLHNPALWDNERMYQDLKQTKAEANNYKELPMNFGAFPVPSYNSLGKGTFRGLGVQSSIAYPAYPEYHLKIAEKDVMFMSFTMNASPLYDSKEMSSMTFFTIITVVDTLTADSAAIGSGNISSRNHPDYVGQGYFQTKNHKIDFIAFVTPENENYAIVNNRLFHLNQGKIIIIAPQKDGSLRSMQIKDKDVDDEENYFYIKNDILQRLDVQNFLNNDGVI